MEFIAILAFIYATLQKFRNRFHCFNAGVLASDFVYSDNFVLFLIQYSIKNVKETVTLLQAYESGFFVEKISQN